VVPINNSQLPNIGIVTPVYLLGSGCKLGEGTASLSHAAVLAEAAVLG